MWVRFSDMSSGGHPKLHIGGLAQTDVYIEAASEDEAFEKFRTEFGLDPYNVTCTCCGQDFAIVCYNTLQEATAYDRGCKWNKERRCWEERQGDMQSIGYMSLQEWWRKSKNIQVRPLPPQNPVTAPVSPRVDSPPVMPAPVLSAVERSLAPTPPAPKAAVEEPKKEEPPKKEPTRFSLLEVD